MTVFDGSFAEWEVVSEERSHAARVAAEEEEALRRVREHKKVERPTPTASKGPDLRTAQRSAQAAEARVAETEAEVARLTAELADPSLYATPRGVERSAKLGARLDEARRKLDAALEEWTLATETVERLIT
jgi:hypothetical protein